MDKAKEKPELDLLPIISGNTSESDKTAATVRSSKPHKKTRNADKNTITCFANFFRWPESSATQEEQKPFLQSRTGTKKFKLE